MAKILISFLGTGAKSENRTYRPATYRLNNADYQSSFVSSVIRGACGIDKMILIGTAHSMWEEVYRVFMEQNGWSVDQNFHVDLGLACDEYNSGTELNVLDGKQYNGKSYKQHIEEAMGNGSKVVLVKYGLNQDELRENASIILGLESVLNDGDELIVDVTHSFRSLPLYIMNLLIYLRNVSSKRVTISHIYYGMLDYIRENNGVAPVVDLSELLKLNDWISAAHSFSRFGNGYKIAELLEAEGDSKAANVIKKFSEVKNLNHLVEMQNQYNNLNCYSKAPEKWSSIAKMVVPKVISEFCQSTRVDGNDSYKVSNYQFKIAKWHFEHINYFAAYTNLSEAVISRCAEFVLSYEGQRLELVHDKDFREAVKDYLKGVARLDSRDLLHDWYILWSDIAPRRNMLAHAHDTNGGQYGVEDMKQSLQGFINRYPTLVQSGRMAVASMSIFNRVMRNYESRVND